MQKQSVLVVWIASIAAALLGGGWVATIGQWVFGLMLLAHIAEFIVYRSLFERAGGSMGHHFAQTLIYGLFHWAPIKQRLEAAEASAPAAE